MPHEYVLRVRREGDAYTATVRELKPGQHPEWLACTEPVQGHPSATPIAAMLSALATARIETFEEPRRSRYAC